MGFLPPPTLRRYSFVCDLSGLGIKGSAIAQNELDTSQDCILIDFPLLGEKYTEIVENVYLFTDKLLFSPRPYCAGMTDSEEAVRRREVGARGPQRIMGIFQQYQGALDLEAGRATIHHEQQTAENLGEHIFQADPEKFTLERY
jgi:hypothetical protein